jgi:hypothetical protein
MTTKSLMALLAAASLMALGGCGERGNMGQTDDSQMGDTAPATTTPAPGTAEPETWSPPSENEDMSTEAPTEPGATTEPSYDPQGSMSETPEDTNDSGSAVPPQ